MNQIRADYDYSQSDPGDAGANDYEAPLLCDIAVNRLFEGEHDFEPITEARGIAKGLVASIGIWLGIVAIVVTIMLL